MRSAVSPGDASRDRSWATDPDSAARPLLAWSETISEGITEMAVSAPREREFRARWRRYGLGPIDLNFLQAAPQRVVRSEAVVRRTRAAEFDLLYLRQSSADLVHAGREVRVPEGAFVLLDNRLPYTLTFERDSDCLTAHLSDRWLRRFVPHPAELAGRPVPAAAGWGAPLAAMLVTIERHGLDRAALPRAAIADQLGAQVALMAGAPCPADSRHGSELLARVRRELEARFDEPALDPAALAQSVGISKRHLHGLFAQTGTTFGTALIELRLGRAAAMLADPRFRAYSIGDVAWACGFADASHFARRFRQRHGTGPAAWRRAAG